MGLDLSYLRHIQIGLHNQEGIESVRPRGVGVIKKVADFIKSSLQAGAAKVRGDSPASSGTIHCGSGVEYRFQT